MVLSFLPPASFSEQSCVDGDEYSCARGKCSVNPGLGSLTQQNPAGNRASCLHLLGMGTLSTVRGPVPRAEGTAQTAAALSTLADCPEPQSTFPGICVNPA